MLVLYIQGFVQSLIATKTLRMTEIQIEKYVQRKHNIVYINIYIYTHTYLSKMCTFLESGKNNFESILFLESHASTYIVTLPTYTAY